MPKDTKTLGNNKARACESLGFVHKKRLCQRFDTTSFYFIATDKRKLHKKTVDFLFQEIAYRSIFSKIAYFNLANASLIRRIASTMFSSLVA